jgi:hypothetical protein
LKTLKEITTELISLEEEISPENQIYFGSKVWPLIRLSLAKGQPHKNTIEFLIVDLIKKTLLVFFNFFTLPFVRQKLPKKSILFFNYNSERKHKVDGKYVFSISDSLINLLTLRSFVQLEYSPLTNKIKPAYRPSTSATFGINLALLKARIRMLFLRKKPETLNSRVWAVLKEKNIEYSTILLLEESRQCEKYFEKVLKESQVNIVFISGIVDRIGLAAVHAANKLGIKTCDVQHGQQGDFHPMYTNWRKFPSSGYRLLPSYFWLWDDISKKRIDTWSKRSVHNAIIGGNPWLTWRFGEVETSRRDTKKKNQILLCLQEMNDFYDSFIINVIKKTSHEYEWMIRLHPSKRKELTKAKEYVKTLGLEDDNFIKANEQNIFELLQSSTYLITFWSTVAYEGLMFDTHPIIIHQNGKDAMRQYIKQGHFSYADSESAFLAALQTINQKKVYPYTIDKKRTITTFEKLVNTAG